mgnify:CR=1 FL=1
MIYRGLYLHVNWIKGSGFYARDAPKSSGLYAQIYWPEKAVRIGQSSDIRSRLSEATAWAKAMHLGTARVEQLRRTSEICERVKATGNSDFEYFVISESPEFSDKAFRLECEAFLFGWFASFAKARKWKNWNREKLQSKFKPFFEEGMQSFENSF